MKWHIHRVSRYVRICQIGSLWGSLYEWHREFARTVLEHPDVPMHLKSDDVIIIQSENNLKRTQILPRSSLRFFCLPSRSTPIPSPTILLYFIHSASCLLLPALVRKVQTGQKAMFRPQVLGPQNRAEERHVGTITLTGHCSATSFCKMTHWYASSTTRYMSLWTSCHPKISPFAAASHSKKDSMAQHNTHIIAHYPLEESPGRNQQTL